MSYLLAIIILFFILIVSVLLTARIILRAGREQEQFYVKLTVLNCGGLYDISGNRAALVLGRWKKYFKPGDKKKKPATKDKPTRKKKKTAKKRSFGQLSWSARIKIAKAFLLYSGRFLGSIKYDEGQLKARPVMADPALAGMAYGFGAAVYGIFPDLRQTLDVFPAFSGQKSEWTGHIVFSIRIRQIIYISCRLIGDLPIMEIVKYWMKRGK